MHEKMQTETIVAIMNTPKWILCSALPSPLYASVASSYYRNGHLGFQGNLDVVLPHPFLCPLKHLFSNIMSDYEDDMDVDVDGLPSKSTLQFSSDNTGSKGKRIVADLPVEAEDNLPWHVALFAVGDRR